MVPNIVHFIYFLNENSRPFNYVNYLAVKSANDIQKPAYIFVYCNKEPKNNQYWNAMRKLERVMVVLMDAPDQFEGVSLRGHPQYQADVVRLQRLHKMGGIYLDTDAIVLKPMNDFFAEGCTMSAFKSEDGELAYGNSTVIAQKQSPFIAEWIKRLPEGLRSDVWAWHASNLPAVIAKEMPNTINTVASDVFMPYHFTDDSYLVSYTEEKQIQSCLAKCRDSYVVHLWETYYKNVVPNINENYVSKADTPLAHLLRNIAGN